MALCRGDTEERSHVEFGLKFVPSCGRTDRAQIVMTLITNASIVVSAFVCR